MATLLPNPKTFSHLYFPLPIPKTLIRTFSRLVLVENGEKPHCASSVSSHRRRKCGVAFASQRRQRGTPSTGCGVVSGDDKEHWDEEEEEEEERKEFVPLREMTRWLQNKPAGFGEGRTYDTLVEEKLLEEIDRSRKAQVGEKRKPRGNAKEVQEKQKVTGVIQSGTEVRVSNLPKKKNIDRDLWKAFRGFPGIMSVNPAVTGNRKTRDPICKGFAFIVLESDEAAYRFVEMYSKQNLFFGKVEKQISCDVINAHGVIKHPASSSGSSTSNMPEHRDSGDEMSMPYISGTSESTSRKPLFGQDKKELVLPNDINHLLSANKTTEMTFEQSSISHQAFSEGSNKVNEDPQSDNPMPSLQRQKRSVHKREKAKLSKSPKLHTLGSFARLKIKERAVLTGVLSKYGEVASAASKEIL